MKQYKAWELLPEEKVYLKFEADKVIAELEESHKMEVEQLLMEIVKLKKSVESWIGSYEASRRINARIESKLRHQKYKRCLAMARWCRTSARCDEGLGAFKYRDWYWKWFKRWLELAKKFK